MSRIESEANAPMLCVSIHDVAPATWADCLRLVEAVRAVADIPLTWLVVPHYHFRPEQSPVMEACLNVALERGDELALHGYSHLDTEAGSGGLRTRFLRNIYTRREGEFAALAEAEARRRLELGLDWFAARGWTPTGFVPPAWLLGEGAWRALRASSFAYTTTFSHFHCLPGAGNRQADKRGDCSRVGPNASNDERDRRRSSDPHAWRRGEGAGIQYGSGSAQGGHGNQSGPSGAAVAGAAVGDPVRALNRQFDARGWMGGSGNESRHEGRGGRGGHDGSDGRDGRDDETAARRPQRPPYLHARAMDETWADDEPLADDAPSTALNADLGEPLGAGASQREPLGRPPSGSPSASPGKPLSEPLSTPNNRHGTHAILSPSLVYAARNWSGRFLSPRVADATAAMLARSPLVRFSLHPPDARYPELVRHIQRVLERLLEQREAVTKAEFARRLTSIGHR